MQFYDIIHSRRSIRRFKSDPVASEAVTRILEAARLAPSGTNSQPWKLLVVREAQTRAALRQASFDQPFLEQAPVIIVLLGDRQIYKKRLRRGKELVDIGAADPQILQHAAEYMARNKGSDAADQAILANCCIAGEHIVLAATAEGLGCCWVMLFDADRLREILSLPDHLFPVALLPVGHPDQNPDQRPRYPLEEIAWDETIGAPWAG